MLLESSDEGGDEEETGDRFLDSRNFCFLLSFLLCCEGEIFLIVFIFFSLVSRKKEKLDPTLMLNEKVISRAGRLYSPKCMSVCLSVCRL